MKGQNSVLDQRQIFVSTDPVPRRSVLLLTVCAYLALLTWIVWPARAPKIRKVAETYAVQKISPAGRLSFNSSNASPARPRSRLFVARPRAQRMVIPETETPAEDGAIGILREHAKAATAAIVVSIKERQIYGFSTINYQIPKRISGEVPPIPASDVPPRFEQYVVVEATIDVDGHVAYARIVAGSVDLKIQRTLIAAVREFKYDPATRDGTPIPSQVDIVVHIPT